MVLDDEDEGGVVQYLVVLKIFLQPECLHGAIALQFPFRITHQLIYTPWPENFRRLPYRLMHSGTWYIIQCMYGVT